MNSLKANARAEVRRAGLLCLVVTLDLYSAGAPVTSPGGMGTQFGIPFPTITAPSETAERARISCWSTAIRWPISRSRAPSCGVFKNGFDIPRAPAEPAVGDLKVSLLQTLRRIVSLQIRELISAVMS